MNQLEGIQVLSNELIQGPAAFVEERQGSDEDVLAQELRAYVLDNGIAVPGARGPIDAFRRIVRRIRGRTITEDLGEHELSINWLTFHVPMGGKGKLHLANSEESELGIQLGLLGLGFGSGRRVTLSINQDFRERNHCLRLSQLVRARVLRHTTDNYRDPAQIQVDVLELLAHQAATLEQCTDCLSAAVDVSMLEQAGPTIDLTLDPVGRTQEEEFLLEDNSEIEIGLPLSLPGLEISPSVAVNRSVHLRCTILYEFPGGHRFTPYRKLDNWEDLPLWRRD